MQTAGYEIDVIVTGYPGKSVCHGGLGWSTVSVLRGHGRTVLVDTGSFGMRQVVHERLKSRGLAPADVTDILLTHCHHDHSINFTAFERARITISRIELDWALTVPWGKGPVPELYVRELSRRENVCRAEEGQEVLPGITAHLAPGHTPGCTVYRMSGADHDVIFTGDAAKNRAELLCRQADKTENPETTAASIERIWSMWREKPGSVVIPGHDVPMTQTDGAVHYVRPREASINAWFGDDMDHTTTFDLTGG